MCWYIATLLFFSFDGAKGKHVQLFRRLRAHLTVTSEHGSRAFLVGRRKNNQVLVMATSMSVSSLLLLLVVVAVSTGEEDFAFEPSPGDEDIQQSSTSSSSSSTGHVRRHWGMVLAGKLLHVNVPAGAVDHYESLFHLEPYSAKEGLLSDQVVHAGPSNVKKCSSHHTTAIRWQVGCEGRVWKTHADFVHQLRHQAQDGTLAEVVQQPIVGWHVKTEASDAHRERRETGSGDFDDEEEDLHRPYTSADNTEETDTVPEARVVPTMASPIFPEATSHLHRHHHGEELPDVEASLVPTSTQALHLPISPTHTMPLMHTTTLVPVRPTRLVSLDPIQPSRVYDIDAAPSATPVFVMEVEPSVTPEYGSTQVTDPLPISNVTGVNDTILSSTGSSTSSQSSTPGGEEEEEVAITTPPLPRATTERVSPATRPTDETTEYGQRNFVPNINKRLGKFPLTAGKVFKYHIPENTFMDLEDGNTRSLRLIFKTPEGTSVNYTYWAQFNPETQEVYALPLDENVSKWKFIVEALDKEGKSASDYLELSVQHDKSCRAVNHEFSLHLNIERNYEYPSVVNWELEVLEALVKLYGDPDASQITVRSVNVTDPVVFTWTNDTLPKTHCPKDDIDRIYKVLVSDDHGKPSPQLKEALGPKLKVTKVVYKGLGQCSKPPTKPEFAAPPPRKHENFSPTPRNQVDHIPARVGELLIFVVPEDSFYDPKDGGVRNLKLSLMTMDRSPVPPDHWLQFDVKNQEFYGVPLPGDEGREEFQLECEDKEGLKAYGSLVVEVSAARGRPYSVEFSMTLDTAYEKFRNSAQTKRHFVEKVLELFGDRNATGVTVSGVQPDDGDVAQPVAAREHLPAHRRPAPRAHGRRRGHLRAGEPRPRAGPDGDAHPAGARGRLPGLLHRHPLQRRRRRWRRRGRDARGGGLGPGRRRRRLPGDLRGARGGDRGHAGAGRRRGLRPLPAPAPRQDERGRRRRRAPELPQQGHPGHLPGRAGGAARARQQEPRHHEGRETAPAAPGVPAARRPRGRRLRRDALPAPAAAAATAAAPRRLLRPPPAGRRPLPAAAPIHVQPRVSQAEPPQAHPHVPQAAPIRAPLTGRFPSRRGCPAAPGRRLQRDARLLTIQHLAIITTITHEARTRVPKNHPLPDPT